MLYVILIESSFLYQYHKMYATELMISFDWKDSFFLDIFCTFSDLFHQELNLKLFPDDILPFETISKMLDFGKKGTVPSLDIFLSVVIAFYLHIILGIRLNWIELGQASLSLRWLQNDYKMEYKNNIWYPKQNQSYSMHNGLLKRTCDHDFLRW